MPDFHSLGGYGGGRRRAVLSRPQRLLHTLMGVALLTGCGLLAAPAAAQESYPAKPVRLVVSYAPGNVTDLVARIVGQKLAQQWGQPVVVENRPGQGGSMGAQLVAKAPADGYTLLFSAMAALCINPHLYADVGYKALTDFSPVVNVAEPSFVVVVNPALKVGTFGELVAYSKANPSALSYGTAGNGTAPHLNMEALKRQTGLLALHVPYKSAAAVTTDVIGGVIQIQQESLSVLLPHISSGRLVALMDGSGKRLPQLPDVPSASETVPGFVSVTPWLGLLAPAHTPSAITSKISRDVQAILRQPDVLEKFAANGLSVTGEEPEAFKNTLARDYERLGRLVKSLAIKVD